MLGGMHLPEPRGPLSAALLTRPRRRHHAAPGHRRARPARCRRPADPTAVLTDDDVQLSLAVCYELHYRGFDDVDEGWEWDPDLLALRRELERAAPGRPARAGARAGGRATSRSTGSSRRSSTPTTGPSLSRWLAQDGQLEHWREYLTLRSVYHLKEGDPHSFAIPRLSGRAKSAMVEIQADEYGGGSAARMHSELFAGMMRDLGLDGGYGALWDAAPAAAFASVNTMSLFGLHRRWRAAAVGHLTAVEMTSSEPSRRYSTGLRRLGFGPRTTVFYDEHVEADAVHEQIAAVDMCGSLVAEDPRWPPTSCSGPPARWPSTGWRRRSCWRPGRPGRSALRRRASARRLSLPVAGAAPVISQPKTAAAGNMRTL